MKYPRKMVAPAVLLAAGLAGCNNAKGLSEASGKTPGADPGCQVSEPGHSVRVGEQILHHMRIYNDGRYCVWGAGISGGAEAPVLSRQPEHGVVTLASQVTHVVYQYRAIRGYVGSDSFGFVLHADGYDFPVYVSVSVVPVPPA